MNSDYSKNTNYQGYEEQGLSGVWTHATDIVIDHGEGIYLVDDTGKKYMDFTSGIGVTSTGHCHPKVVKAIKEQAEKLIFGQMNIVYHKPVLDLIRQLKRILPEELNRFFFSNSGAEAVEAAVKLSKQYTGRQNVIVFQGSFHGRTHLTMSMTTSKTIYRTHYQPLVPGIFVSPYPYSFYYGWDDETTLHFAIRELERLLKSQTAADETACIVVEPVLGEGGYVVPPKGFLKALREICDRYDILLVVDEIQSGFARTGRYFAFQHEGIVPDIITMAKGIASGMTLSGIAYKKKLEEKWLQGSHGGTFGGNPVACAAGAATIGVIIEEKLDVNARERGNQLLSGLEELKKDFPVIGDVRGLGLMVATEFVKNPEGKPYEPDSDIVSRIKKEAFKEGLLLLSCGTFGNIIRWIPPLIVTEAQIDEALSIFKRVLERV